MIYDLGPRGRRVYDWLRERIVSGAFPPDTKLAAATQLAVEFGVAPMTVRNALARLEGEGLISREYGRGTFVRARTTPPVLIVESKAATRNSLRRRVVRMGYRTVEAASPEEALERLDQDTQVALVLTGVRLPDASDGVAFIRTVRRRWPDHPVVALAEDSNDLADLYGKKEWPMLLLPKPVRAEQIDEALRMALRPREPHPEPERARVLVVDDEPEVRTALRMVLETLDCDVEEAATGGQARAALRRQDFSHVFLDLHMPGGGLDTAKAIAKAHPDTTVVLATAYPQDMLQQSDMLFTFLRKPFTIEAVADAVQLHRRSTGSGV